MKNTHITHSCADLSTVSTSSIQPHLADLPSADRPVVLTGEGAHGAETALPGEALSPTPTGMVEAALDFSINDMDGLYDDEAYEIAAKVKTALAPFSRDIASKSSFELLVKWLLVPVLNKLLNEVSGLMCSDREMTAMSPRPIPAPGDQPKRFLSLFPANEFLYDPHQKVEMTTFNWLTSSCGLPEEIYHMTRDQMGNERRIYLVVHFYCGCLGNGAGFIFRYLQVSRGMRLRTLVKSGDLYCAWYDRLSEGMDQIVGDLIEYGVDDFFFDDGHSGFPVPGLADAEMIYNDI